MTEMKNLNPFYRHKQLWVLSQVELISFYIPLAANSSASYESFRWLGPQSVLLF